MKQIKFSAIFLAFLFLISCQPKEKQVQTEVSFGKYVQAFTSGIISTESKISVYLNQPVSNPENIGKKLFSFSPEIEGEAVFLNNYQIEFRPSEPLKSGTIYSAEFLLGEIMETDAGMQKMPFQFSTIKQSFSINLEGLTNYESAPYKKMQFNGYLLTADVADFVQTEKILQASFEDKKVTINWIHEPNRRKHFFSIDSLDRPAEKTGELIIEWEGEPLNVDIKGEEKFEVPATNAFTILAAKVVHEPEQHIEIRFSDPILKSQDLTGLIALSDGTELRLIPENRSEERRVG